MDYTHQLTSQLFDFYLRKGADRKGGGPSVRERLAQPADLVQLAAFAHTSVGFRLIKIFSVEVIYLLHLVQ